MLYCGVEGKAVYSRVYKEGVGRVGVQQGVLGEGTAPGVLGEGTAPGVLGSHITRPAVTQGAILPVQPSPREPFY